MKELKEEDAVKIDTIAEVKKVLEEHEKRISQLEGLSKAKPEPVTKKFSIKEFILSKKPGNDVQKALAIGYYFEKYEGFSSFNVQDLENGFRSAKEPVPENINDKVNKNIYKGHMMEAKQKKDDKMAWVLTNSGEEYIESGFKRK